MIGRQEEEVPKGEQGELLPNAASRLTHLLIISEAADDIKRAMMTYSRHTLSWDISTERAVADVLKDDKLQVPDMVVLDITSGLQEAEQLLDHAKAAWPYAGFLAFTESTELNLQPLTHQYGEMPLLYAPSLSSLCAAIETELASFSFGALRGMALPNVLQMLQWEKKSVAILASTGALWGRLHLRGGELVEAYVHQGHVRGDAAALEILSWKAPALSLERSYQNQRQSVTRPIHALLMEALRKQDESSHHDKTPSTSLSEDAEEVMFFKRSQKRQGNAEASRESLNQIAASALADDLPSPSASPSRAAATYEVSIMANVKTTLDSVLNDIEGAMAAALVDYDSGMALGTAGTGVNLEVAAAGNTEVVKAKIRTMQALGIQGSIEDILITLQQQYHIIYLIPGQTLFLYLVLNKDRANLAMARYKLKALAADLKL